MYTTDRDGIEWHLMPAQIKYSDIPTGKVEALHKNGDVSRVSDAAYLHWTAYLSHPEFNIVAFRKPVSTCNANDAGLPCLREQQFDKECAANEN